MINENEKQLQFDLGFEVKPTVKQSNNFMFDLMDCLRSPIITYTTHWSDTLPKDVLEQVTPERLLNLLAKEQKATICETVIYLCTASLQMPLTHEWAEIYTWCGLQFAKQYRNPETVAHIKEIAPSKLSDHQQSKLESLQKWIYEKRRKDLKDKLKSQKLI